MSIPEDVLNGVRCSICRKIVGAEVGYPRLCTSCVVKCKKAVSGDWDCSQCTSSRSGSTEMSKADVGNVFPLL